MLEATHYATLGRNLDAGEMKGMKGKNTSRLALKALALSIAGVLSLGALSLPASVSADEIMIPQIGTAGVRGITIQKEIAIGDFFMRTARSNMNVLDDPVLNEYVTSLGNKLLSHADNVNFPFTFFVVQDNNLNASAFLGGKVAINTGLFKYAYTEDEFASVIAHEISHVTQRHIARFVESMVVANQLSMAGLIGSIVMAIVNPALGMAAMSTTMGAQMQSRINFTRDNEYEADRIGIALLYKAGLNPAGAVNMFKRLLAEQGNINPAFTLLIDHPLSDIRVAEAQSRAWQYPKRQDSKNPEYAMAQARIDVRYSTNTTKEDYQNLVQVLKHNPEGHSNAYVNYALALSYFELEQYEAALESLSKLPNNLFVLDLKSDIDLKRGHHAQAIERLQSFYKRLPLNQVVVVNLAHAYNDHGQYTKAADLLENYLLQKPNDVLALSILEEAQKKLKNKCEALQTRAEIYALNAAYQQAIGMYSQALRECPEMLTRERIKARVSQIAVQRSFDESLLNN